MSSLRCWYLACFLSLARSVFPTVSHVTVSSASITCCGVTLLSIKTKSGREAVSATSGGSVPPFTLQSFRSANICILSGLIAFRVLNRRFTQESLHCINFIFRRPEKYIYNKLPALPPLIARDHIDLANLCNFFTK